MKIAPKNIESFIRNPDPGVRAVLLYGPDGGLVRERAGTLLATVVEDPADPFQVTELSAADLKDDPARLADEAAAMSLTGGRRVVRLRPADDGLASRLQDFLAESPGEALVVVEAGDLGARSPLRKAFEGARQGAAVPCYRDDERGLSTLITESLRAEGLRASPDALAYLTGSLGGDRQLTRRELEKLALYKGGGGEIDLAEAQAVVGDSAARTLDDLAYAMADGQLRELDRILNRAFQEGAQPVTALRAGARHLQRLHLVSGQVALGAPLGDAVAKLRPPPFWRVRDRFTHQARAWSREGLGRALARLLEAERSCKQTGAPAETICARALLSIAHGAPGRARRATR
ncbi:MAG: DNA polymerase III subunit delta [Kiloniellales bacterium]